MCFCYFVLSRNISDSGFQFPVWHCAFFLTQTNNIKHHKTTLYSINARWTDPNTIKYHHLTCFWQYCNDVTMSSLHFVCDTWNVIWCHDMRSLSLTITMNWRCLWLVREHAWTIYLTYSICFGRTLLKFEMFWWNVITDIFVEAIRWKNKWIIMDKPCWWKILDIFWCNLIWYDMVWHVWDHLMNRWGE